MRHHHKLGLVEEPERDSSGYRRYGSVQLLRLVQVRTLAGAGVPYVRPRFHHRRGGRRPGGMGAGQGSGPRGLLATAMADHYLANPAQLRIVTGLQARTQAATRYKPISQHAAEQAPASARLTALVETKLRAAGVRVPGPDSR
ncbi:hypothetical protein GCM10010104_59060 [Streptomyces indiaensis]|uniref:HTH merR-type domain-containing protein n=2 Tax=Streptomyces TaxID=1883 RepID=A0ABN3ECM8_9ACTN